MPSPVIIDTNILIDHFNGLHEAHQELNYHRDAMISIITWIEMTSVYEAKLAAGALSDMEFKAANLALGTFPVIAINGGVLLQMYRRSSGQQRRRHRLRQGASRTGGSDRPTVRLQAL